MRRLALLALLIALSCSPPTALPRGQIVLWVDTDAWLRATPSSTTEGAVFDSLRVEVFEPNAAMPCDGCTRTFLIDAERVRRRDLSFGIPMHPNDGRYRVRLRMYPSFATLSGDPPDYGASPATSVVETVVRLPAIADVGLVERQVFLAVGDIGAPRGSLDFPVETLPGRPTESKVNTWPGAIPQPCTLDAREGEVCIPGGAFWMGNAKLIDTGLGDGNDRLRLVVLSPFFIGATEVTVKLWRTSSIQANLEWSGNTDGVLSADYCTYVDAIGQHDDLPINCVERLRASNFCRARDSELPTEAQFEYVASSGKNRLWVWGDDEPSCDDAVLNRGGWGLFDVYAQDCKTSKPPGGVLTVGAIAERRDRHEAGVWDLIGNLSEFAADRWNRQTEDCWSHPGVFQDPRCDTPSTLDKAPYVIRGGSFVDEAHLAAAANRAQHTGEFSPRIGFRCVRPATD